MFDVGQGLAVDAGHHAAGFPAQAESGTRAGEQACHAHRGDGGELGAGGADLGAAEILEQAVEFQAEFVAQGVHHEVGHPVAAFLEVGGHQTVEHVGVGQAALGGPAGARIQ